MLKKSASFVLASFRPATYPRGYASGLHSLRPCRTAFLSILREVSYCASKISLYAVSVVKHTEDYVSLPAKSERLVPAIKERRSFRIDTLPPWS